MSFNSSYYRRQVQHENTKHFQIKKWISDILQTYDFNVSLEFTDPQLLAPKNIINEKRDPYILDIIAYNEFRNEFITAEVNGPYHYKQKKIAKDSIKLEKIIEWIPNFITKIIHDI